VTSKDEEFKLDLNLGDLEKGQRSGAFKTVACHGTKVQEINQVKLGGYSSNKGHLYTGDRGKSLYSNEASMGAHQDQKKQKHIGREKSVAA
jgi:hypothetical protein